MKVSPGTYTGSDKVILITGASRGIGRYLAANFSASGAVVYGTFHLNAADSSSNLKMSRVDVSDPQQVAQWINSLPLAGKRIVLLNAAGVTYNAYTHKADPDKWMDVIRVNLLGTFNTIRFVLPFMRSVGYGRIINFSSVVAHIGVPGTSSYAASKAALWGLSKAVSAENASKGITVNSLDLGYFDIGMLKDVPEDMRADLLKKIPIGKYGDPKNISDAVDFLIRSEYTTGESLNINGGIY